MTPSSSPFEDALYGQAADADSHAAASPLFTSASVAATATTTPPLQPSPRKLGTSSMPLIMTRSAGNSAQGSPDHDQHAATTTPQPRARGHQEQQQHLPMASLPASEPPRSRSPRPTPLLILKPLLQAQETSAESSFVHWVEGGPELPGEPSSLQRISSPRNRSPAATPKVDDASATASASRIMSHGAAGPNHKVRPFNTHSLSGGIAGTKAVEPMQPFTAYVRAEASAAAETLPTSDVVWGQTERDTVYNFLLYLPCQLEALLQFSLLLCFDAFLGVITLLPLRCLLAWRNIARGMRRKASSKDGSSSSSRGFSNDGQAPSPGSAVDRAALGGGSLFDLVCLAILACTTVVLYAIRPAAIYFWLRDATNEFLKLSVLVAALEIGDKILADFSLKVLQALQGTCSLWCMGVMSTWQLLCDAWVAFVMVLVHGLTLMCQGLILSIAINSARHGLLALLIGSNFYEVKGSVFKRWDKERIRQLAWMDFVERFQLVATLLFVVVEDMRGASSFLPNLALVRELGRILGAETLIDILKHAVISKFNDQRPGIYKEYMKDLCDKVVVTPSHNLHTLLRFPHLASAALFLRSAALLFLLKLDTASASQVALRAVTVLGIWTSLVALKVLMGYALKLAAHYLSAQLQAKGFQRASKQPTKQD